MVKNNKNLKKEIRKAWAGFVVVLAVLLVLGLFVHPHHGFEIEESLFFYAWFGFYRVR